MDIGSLTGKITLEDQMSAVLKKTDDALTKFGESATGSAQKMSNLGTSMTAVGKAMTALSIPITAVGGAALAAGYSIESAYNTIARKTGETGEALAGLKKDFEAVFATVPNSAQEVATAIADVHQRLGLTGVELQGVTKKFIDFANVNAIDVATATKTVSTLMGALSKDTKLSAEEIGNASSIMDKLTYASQISGASVGKLAEGVVRGGVAFTEMGFGLNESIALFAQFEKVGANTTDVTASLGRVMANLAKSGVTDLAGAFKKMVTEIRDAPKYADSLRMSIETFGSIAGPKLAEEIRGGTYSVAELSKTLEGLGNVTQNTAKQSESFTESLGTLKNQLTLALAPLGIQMIESFKKLIPAIADAISILAKLVDLFAKLPDGVQTFVLAIGGIVAVVGPVILVLGVLYEKFLLLGGARGIAYVGGLLAEFGVTAALTSAAINVATGMGVVGLFVALGYALWEVGKAIKNAYEWFQSGKPMWDFFTQREEDNFIRRGLKWVGILSSVKDGITSVTPGVGFLESELADLADTTDAGSESFDMYKARMNKMRSDAMQPLSAQVQADIREMHNLNYEVQKIAKETGASLPAVKKFIEGLDAGEKASEAFGKALKELGGHTALAGAEEVVRQLGAMGGPLNVLPSKLAGMATALKAGAEAALLMGRADLAGQYQLLARTLDPLIMFQQRYNVTIGEYVTDAHMAETATAAVDEQLQRLSGNVITFGHDWYVMGNLVSSLDLSSTMEPFKKAVTENKPDVFFKDWSKAIGSMGGMFGEMFEGINSQWGQTIKIIGSGLEAITKEGATFGEKLSAGFAMAASTLSTLLDATTESGGGKWGAAGVGALSGAAAGAGIGTMIMPGVGTAVGAGVGAAVGAVTGWISATKKAADAQKEATAEVQKLKAALVEQYGSLEQLEEMSTRLFGMSFVAEWGNQGVEGLKKMTEFTRDFEARLASVTDAVNKMLTGFAATTTVLTDGTAAYGEAVAKAQADYDKLAESGKATEEQLTLAAANVTDALNAQYEAGVSSTQMLSDLGIQGVAAFGAVYMATGSYTEALKAVGPSLATLNQSYMDLGLSVDNVALRHLMLQSAVLEANPQLMAAIEGQTGAMQGMAQMGLLNAETFAAMQRTGIELYTRLQAETVTAAEKAGDLGDQTVNALLPMQTYLQQATTQAELLGLPLDENTQMLVDQSKALGIWKEAGKSANDKLIEGMSTLVSKMDAVLGTLNGIIGGLNNIPSSVHSEVRVDHHDYYYAHTEGGSGEEIHGMQSGGIGYTTRPTLFMSSESGRPEEFAFSGEGKSFDREGGGGGSSGDSGMVVGAIERLSEEMAAREERTNLAFRDALAQLV